MSDLTAFRDHCWDMAARSATPAGDVALWLKLADEIEAYLRPADDGPGLFGEGS